MYRFLATGYLLRYGKLTVLSYNKKGAYKKIEDAKKARKQAEKEHLPERCSLRISKNKCENFIYLQKFTFLIEEAEC